MPWRAAQLEGKTFGDLMVLRRADENSRGGKARWVCECHCGRPNCYHTVTVTTSQLTTGKTTRCAARTRPKELIGQRFGRWTVIGPGTPTQTGRTRWLCQCDCGTEKPVCQSDLLAGTSRSCGCLIVEAAHRRRGENNSGWKGGRFVDRWGYVLINGPKHPNARTNGMVAEHIAVMSELLGRPLQPEETVHHKNGIRSDNRPENLELWTGRHPFGVRTTDLLSFCLNYLQENAPGLLREQTRSDV